MPKLTSIQLGNNAFSFTKNDESSELVLRSICARWTWLCRHACFENAHHSNQTELVQQHLLLSSTYCLWEWCWWMRSDDQICLPWRMSNSQRVCSSSQRTEWKRVPVPMGDSSLDAGKLHHYLSWCRESFLLGSVFFINSLLPTLIAKTSDSVHFLTPNPIHNSPLHYPLGMNLRSVAELPRVVRGNKSHS